MNSLILWTNKLNFLLNLSYLHAFTHCTHARTLQTHMLTHRHSTPSLSLSLSQSLSLYQSLSLPFFIFYHFFQYIILSYFFPGSTKEDITCLYLFI